MVKGGSRLLRLTVHAPAFVTTSLQSHFRCPQVVAYDVMGPPSPPTYLTSEKPSMNLSSQLILVIILKIAVLVLIDSDKCNVPENSAVTLPKISIT